MARALSVQLLFLTFAIMASAFPVRPIPFRSSLYTSVDFQDPRQGLEALQVPLSVMAAAPQLEFSKDDSDGSVCSSTVVSDDGKLLTASHCLDDCARDAGLLEEKPGYWAVDTKRLSRMNCTIKVNGVRTEVKVLAMAPCIQSGVEYRFPDYQKNCKNLDYAIIVPTYDRVSSAPCLRISESRLDVGADVFSVGYPRRSFRALYRKGARGTTGKSLELTSGKVMAPQGKCFVDIDENSKGAPYVKRGDRNFPNPKRTAEILGDVRLGRLIQTSTDLLPGMSGSSLVEVSSGEIYGIAMFHEGNSAMTFCSGGGFYSSSSHMFEDLRENFPNLDLKTALKCEKRAVFPQSNAPSDKKADAPVLQRQETPERSEGVR